MLAISPLKLDKLVEFQLGKKKFQKIPNFFSKKT
jgi:hypothetical protein